ncbi:MAG: sulfur oxidation c-type cytochrome SoxA [Rhodospirillales bacterium]|nr:sulfur oxidation c-type cytochrome SoxA [Rhodospirillales bacterium]
MVAFKLGALFAAAAGFVMANAAVYAADAPNLNDPKIAKYVAGDKWSGYVTSTPETRKMQDDDFENPSFVWVDQARALWDKVDGKAGKSCASCHGEVEKLKGASTTYPKFVDKHNDLITVEHQIGICRTKYMEADAWKWEGDQMLGMSALVRLQSRGMPVNVSIDGKNKPFYEKGREFYYQRRGHFDFSCAHCHVDNYGNMIRSELLSHGMPNGFPQYRLKWQKLGSMHRRFRGCNKNTRAEPYKQGSPEYTALELYTMWRASGLPVETPAVRK